MTRVALITGGQRGIGFGIAAALARAGFTVALASEMPSDSGEVQRALAELGSDTRYFHHDLRQIDAVAGLVGEVEAQCGPVTTLISNAGVSARVRGDMLELTPEHFDLVQDINLRGTFFLAQEVARRMIERPAEDYRSLIFITSVSAAMVSIERAEYCISKAGAAMMAQLFAARLAPHGIGVFDLRPGIIATAMTEPARARHDAGIAEGLVPAGRWGTPSDVADAVLPLAEGRMAFATGAVIPVDGGLSIPRL